MMYKNFLKRILDFLIALFGLLVLSPLFLILVIILYSANRGGGVFFTQERPGMDERIFKLYKFKSMLDKRNEEGDLLPDKDRITSVGKFMRQYSLDEIPQLFNVLKGDMSLIGPRPLLVCYLGFYSKRERIRHSVRPGITGLAQINGRNNLSWEDRLELDVCYTEKVSFKLDANILFKTIFKVLRKENIIVVLDYKKNIPLNELRKKINN